VRARIGIGALGAISAVTIRCFPSFTLRREDSAAPARRVLVRFDEMQRNDHSSSFTFPTPTGRSAWSEIGR